MKRKYFVKSNTNEVINKIKSHTNNKLIDLLFGKHIIISKFKKNNEIILIARTHNELGTNFYFFIEKCNNGVKISGEFRFSLFIKIFYLFSVAIIIFIILHTISPFSSMNIFEDKAMFIIVLFSFLLVELLIFLLRNFFGRREQKMILKFLDEIIGTEEIVEDDESKK